MTKQDAKQMAEKIMDACIDVCMNRYWDESKEVVRSMFTTACEIGGYEADTDIADGWLDRIFDCYHDWYDRQAFRVEFENYMLEYIV